MQNNQQQERQHQTLDPTLASLSNSNDTYSLVEDIVNDHHGTNKRSRTIPAVPAVDVSVHQRNGVQTQQLYTLATTEIVDLSEEHPNILSLESQFGALKESRSELEEVDPPIQVEDNSFRFDFIDDTDTFQLINSLAEFNHIFSDLSKPFT